MAMDISKANVGDMTTDVSNYSVDTAITDGASDQKETTWMNTDFSQHLGYYKSIPELKSLIDTRAKWVIGKGIKGKDKKIVEDFRGFGKDTGNTLIKNMVQVYHVGGDFFGEIIRNESIFRKIITWSGILKPKKPVNIKPLDPAVMKIVVNGQGMIERYEQLSRVAGKEPKKFKPEEILHLPRNRFADEIHGSSIITAIENIILSRNEAMADMKTVFHRYVKPLWIWQLDTDDPTKIAAFKTKADKTVANSENIYIPRGAADAERVSVPQYSTLDPLPWIRDLTDYFYQATNTPDVVVGSAKQTVEASAKILMLTYEQSIRDEQLFIIDNFKSQLGLEIELEFPTPIETNLMADEKKDANPEQKIKKSEITAELEGDK